MMDNVSKGFAIASTFKQIVELGIRKQLVNSMMRNGMLVKLGHGVYQVKHHVPGEFDEYAIAIAIAGPTALRSRHLSQAFENETC